MIPIDVRHTEQNGNDLLQLSVAPVQWVRIFLSTFLGAFIVEAIFFKLDFTEKDCWQ